ncbi:MAG: FAD-binding protein, partial [Raoultibacter sp.]
YGPKDAEVARLNADKSGETIDWLQDIGVPFDAKVAPRFGYTELPVIHQVEGKGAAMMKVLSEVAERAGVKTMTETRAMQLLPSAEGRVVGVAATWKKDDIRIKANKGVVVTTGSYAGSKEMLTALNAECANLAPGSNPGATGDGIAMAMEFGAFTTRTAELPLMSSLAGLESKSIVNLNYHERLHGLWLDANGARFFNEETPYENPNGHRAIVRKQNEQGKPVVVLLPTTPELEAVLAARPLAWAKADTVEEVAAQVGLDGAKVKATVDRYNAFCAAGRDDDFNRPAEFLIPMTGPFYASSVMVSTSVTLGGIKTNAKAQALKLKLPAGDGKTTEVVPGLYAAGVACEWNCAAGATVLSAMTLGRVAGQNVAKEEPVA